MKDQLNQKRGVQQLAWLFLILFCMSVFKPGMAIAGGGGPTQPEVQSFTPVGVSEMVDPFTGDFSYNIPLMDVEGYPINIAYNSGVTMDQEASWVGLGWNLNTGAIVRNMRGLPDDFNGDVVAKTESQKPQTEVGISLNTNWELFGKKNNDNDTAVSSPSLAAGVKFTYNNYTGYGTTLDFGPSFTLGKVNDAGGQWSADLSFSGSSENGAGFTPGVSYSHNLEGKKLDDAKMMHSFSGGYNSRAGLTYLSYGVSVNDKAKTKESSSRKRQYTVGSSSYDFGLQSYTPSSSASFLSRSVTGKFSGTTTWWGADVQWTAGVYYNIQKIDPENQTRTNPAYGYFHMEEGQKNDYALLDFNRDNEGAFTKYSPNLPSAFLTNDVFSIQAQGMSGSYRAFRNDVGYVFDPKVESKSVSGNIGLEFGAGGLADLGVDLTGYMVKSYSGPWREAPSEGFWIGAKNNASKEIHFETPEGLAENMAFQEANEQSVETDGLFTDEFNKALPEHFHLSGSDILPILTKDVSQGPLSGNSRTERLKRNQMLSFLTIKDVKDGLGLFAYRSDLYTSAADHHIGEITQLGTDGRRYVFGVPAYNHLQREETFAIGNDINDNDGLQPVGDDYSGIVNLGGHYSNAAGVSNPYGIDNYYSSQVTPAYAHSFMLSAVLSDDYIDADEVKGPSENDFGSYVKFDYEKVDQVKWRAPMAKRSAYYNQGLKSDLTDDKASVIYGEKELWYVKVVETKNYIAVFELDSRKDGMSVADRMGGLDPSLGQMKCLKKITLYAKKDYYDHISDLEDATPIQEVHFVYDYSLCQGYPGHINGGGKLTLKEIYFTYQGSYKLKRSSYKFEYNSGNANYRMKDVDRWGNYQPTATGSIDFLAVDSKLNSSDFPYTIQDEEDAASNAQQWTLTDIHLPSGGKIHVDYESDDYAYVQHLQASQMYSIVATGDGSGDMNAGDLTQPVAEVIADDALENRAIFFKLKPGYTHAEDYFDWNEPIYFKTLVNMGDINNSEKQLEYVTGYAFVDSFEVVGAYGKIVFKPLDLLDLGIKKYSPITKAAILFGRANMPRTINDVIDTDEPGADENSLAGFANSIVNSASTFKEYFIGPNKAVYDHERCQELITQHSFIRLLEPTGHKYGGGLRVKRITMFDNWAKMIDSNAPDETNDFTYGQEFFYELEDGRSSGVASYEPLVGGDENSWHKGVSYDEKMMFAPNKEVFLSEPIMESQFPSPSVGYSRIVIQDLKHTGVTRTATGKVVKEFYTAKDFPTVVNRTPIIKSLNSNSLKIATSFLPLLPKYDYLTASQGFVIQTNDMHGKPKAEAVYAEGQERPLSTVNYHYQSKEISFLNKSVNVLGNQVQTIRPDGEMQIAEIGVKYDAVADFRENITKSIGVGPIEINNNAFLAGPMLLVIPTVWSKIDISKSQFRSATLNKTVNKFGILDKVTANQDGSIVETKNLAYDGETGSVLLTETTTNFNDKVYSLNLPAHWKYDQLGQAYKNIGYSVTDFPIYADGFVPVPGAQNHFVVGDEVKVETGSGVDPAWVTEVNDYGIRLLDNEGNPLSAPTSRITIIRSGRRNKQATSMATITALDNPLAGLTSSVYTKVLNAGVVEFSDNWKTYCECLPNESKSINPYTNGTRGNWRPVRSYTHLTDRAQTNTNNNTNIRRDGVFSGFSPYYYYYNNEWRTNPSNWTFVSEVTSFSPNGMTLETKDALGRYSSSLFSFKNTLTTAVAANARQRQVAEGSFEDLDYSNCMDMGVFSQEHAEDVNTDYSHTGHSSMQVVGGTSKTYTTRPAQCDNSTECSISIVPVNENKYEILGDLSNILANITNISGPAYGSATYDSGDLEVEFDTEGYYEIEVVFWDKETGCELKVRINTVLPGNNQLSMQVLSLSQN